MQRKIELIREILLQRESDKTPMVLPDCSGQEEFAYHVALLKEAGLVDAIVVTDHKGMPSGAQVLRLTWSGHDFLDAARNDTVWNTAKRKIIESGMSWTFSMLTEILKALAKQELSKLGLPTGPQ